MQSKMPTGVLGAIIAGGRSKRMGVTTKMAQPLAGKPLLRHIVDRLSPQVERIVLNTHPDPVRWAEYRIDIVSDRLPGHQGPLAGLLSVMEWARTQIPAYAWIAAVPSDTPFLPADLVDRLSAGFELYPDAEAIVARSGRHRHPVIGLFPTSLAEDLKDFLDSGDRKSGLWIDRIAAPALSFPIDPVDPFFNINTMEDLAEAERQATLIDLT